MERGSGSVAKGRRRFYSPVGDPNGGPTFPGVPLKLTRSPLLSFRGGMRALVDGLAGAIRTNDIEALRPSCKVTRLLPAGDPLGAAAYSVESDDGECWIADLCVLALPGAVTANLIGEFAPEVAAELSAVPHASSLSVHLGYARGALRQVPETTGCLVPHSQGRPSLACTLVHARFDYRVPPHTGMVHLQFGGARKPDLLDWDDDAARRVARAEVETLLGIRADPLFAEVRRWRQAHPQYLVGHAAHIVAVEEELAHHSGLLLCGSALYGTTVADVIENGRATARTISDLARTRLA
jgi:oxygen-dependent protoporphyrinogen oxidase